MTAISAGKRGGRKSYPPIALREQLLGGRSKRAALGADLCELSWLCTYRSIRRRQPVTYPPVVEWSVPTFSIWNCTY
jgi:hypothetical protein